MPAEDLARRAREYSRGMKQKVGLIAAMAHDPDLLIFDEPTSGLDPLVRETVFELLREWGTRGKTVFHSSHVLPEVEKTCSRVGIVRAGRLVALGDQEMLRAEAERHMVIEFATAPPLAALEAAGAQVLSVHDETTTLAVQGDLNPVLRTLAQHDVNDLSFAQPSLEEAFAKYYRGDAE